MPYCSDCGMQIKNKQRYCENCGATLSDRGHRTTGNRQSATSQRGRQQRPAAAGGGNPPGASGGTKPSETGSGLSFALDYPKRNGWKPTLIGAALLLLSFLLVPLLALAGYGFRVARSAAVGNERPPAYGDWGGLVVDGVRFVLVYMIAGMIVISMIMVFMMLGTTVALSGELSVWVLFMMVVILVGYGVAFFLINAFLTAFVGNNSIGGAFGDGRWKDLLLSKYFAKSTLVFIVLSFLYSIIFAVSALTIIGALFVYPYMIASFGAYWGLVYRRAAKKGIVPPANEPNQSHGNQPSTRGSTYESR